MTFFDRENDRLAKEILSLQSLIKHGKNTGQDKGAWMANLERDLEELLEAYCDGFDDGRYGEGALLRIQIEDASRRLQEA